MAKKFPCEHCSATIVTKYLKTGESAYCPACGERTPVPDTNDVADDELATVERARSDKTASLSPEAQQLESQSVLDEWKVAPTTQLYSTRAVFWFSFFFTLFGGGLLVAANWRRLGRPTRSRNTLLVTGGLTVLLGILGFMAPEDPMVYKVLSWVGLGLAYALRSHARHEQGHVLDALKSVGRPAAPVMRPALLGSVGMVALVIAVGIYTMQTDRTSNAFEHAAAGVAYQDRGQLDSAMGEYREAFALAPNESIPVALIGGCFHSMGALDSAAYYLENAGVVEPSGEIYHELGLVYAKMERYEDSRLAFLRADSLGADVDPYYFKFLDEQMSKMASDSI